jgi:hypothetical protein|tara:strand:+ start:2853 stop:3062 length:210 start_codon:yes stop_codon:yes gene_type:complete
MKLRYPISTAQQKISAVVSTRDFLLRLTNVKETPRIPREVRREAKTLLRHYPLISELKPILEKELAQSE